MGGGIKSIQRGAIVVPAGGTPAAVTITAVDPSKSELRITGQAATSVSDLIAITLTNATTITPWAGSGGAVSNPSRVYWELTEWK